LPNLSNIALQGFYDEQSEGHDIILIDNLLSASRPIHSKDNDFAQWERIQRWLIRKRQEGKTVIVVHHTGKSGEQLGTSIKENFTDTNILLKKAFEIKMGFQMIFTKTRHFYGPDTAAQLITYEPDIMGFSEWRRGSLCNYRSGKILNLKKRFGNIRDAAHILGISVGEAKLLVEGKGDIEEII
jgi:putative DNA primase/helicase